MDGLTDSSHLSWADIKEEEEDLTANDLRQYHCLLAVQKVDEREHDWKEEIDSAVELNGNEDPALTEHHIGSSSSKLKKS